MEWIPNLRGFKHVSFDLWLTIIKSNPVFKTKRNELLKDYFGIDKPIEEVASVIRSYDLLTNTINEKVCKNFDTYEIYLLILGALSGGNIDRYNKKDLDGFYAESEILLLNNMPLLINESIPNELEMLYNAGVSINILSNTAFIKGSTLRKVLDHYDIGQYFAFQIYSDEAGFSKPGTQIYSLAYDAIKKIGDIQKEEVIHVGDNAVSDYEGALKFGFNAHLLKTHLNEPSLQPA